MIATLLLGDQTGAAAKPGEGHCFHPGGADMNEVHDTSHRIITNFCPVALVGERWIPVATWATNTTYQVIPEGYTPSGATPIDDFNAKFTGARYVIDNGTQHARVFSFGAAQILQTGLTVPGTDFPMSAFLAVLPPLPPGAHTVDILLSLSADHWTGSALTHWPISSLPARSTARTSSSLSSDEVAVLPQADAGRTAHPCPLISESRHRA